MKSQWRAFLCTGVKTTTLTLGCCAISLIFSSNNSYSAEEYAQDVTPPPAISLEQTGASPVYQVPFPEEIQKIPDASQNDGFDQEFLNDDDDVFDDTQSTAIEVPEIQYDFDALPAPVKRMRELIIEATKTGNLEKIRPLVGLGPNATTLTFGDDEGDPVKFLRSVSGDKEGHEIMAILLEVLQAGYVRLDIGTESEIFVWPYFYSVPIQELTPPQKVELFEIITASDYEEMLNFGAYVFYRVGITPDGRWSFFVAGD